MPATDARALQVTDTISSEVIFAVAKATGQDPVQMEPLNSVIDPDALDKLFQTSVGGSPRTGGRVSFTMEGCEVTVRASGEVVVTAPPNLADTPL